MFYHELNFPLDGLLFLNCSPAKFKEVKYCSDMVAGRTNKKKETKGCFKTYASKKTLPYT